MTAKEADISLALTPNGGRYFMSMPNGEDARLTFVNAGENHIIADHTFVPPSYRGNGVGEALVLRLLADARAAGNRITPTCWFVREELERLSPEWDDVRA